MAVVKAIDPQPGQTVLVNGATGGVGSYVVQLLAARGATVVATGAAHDADRLTGLGATTVVDHTAGEQALAAAGLTGTNIIAKPVPEVTGPLAEKAAGRCAHRRCPYRADPRTGHRRTATIAVGQARGKVVIRVAD